MRIILLRPAIVLELLLLALGWVLAVACSRCALCVSSWASNNLPALDWYLGAARKNDKGDE